MMIGLIEARRAAGVTQRQAGAMIDKTQSHYGKIERGLTVLSAQDALTLSRAFSVDIAELIKVTA